MKKFWTGALILMVTSGFALWGQVTVERVKEISAKTRKALFLTTLLHFLMKKV